MPDGALPGRIEGEIAFAEKWANRQGCPLLRVTVFKIVGAGAMVRVGRYHSALARADRPNLPTVHFVGLRFL